MSNDPLASAEQTFTEALSRWSSAVEGSRAGWNDVARAAFDRQHTEPVRLAGESSLTEMRGIRAMLARAMSVLGETAEP
jgi:hypothetical protein